jgi:hypothetical protein
VADEGPVKVAMTIERWVAAAFLNLKHARVTNHGRRVKGKEVLNIQILQLRDAIGKETTQVHN